MIDEEKEFMKWCEEMDGNGGWMEELGRAKDTCIRRADEWSKRVGAQENAAKGCFDVACQKIQDSKVEAEKIAQEMRAVERLVGITGQQLARKTNLIEELASCLDEKKAQLIDAETLVKAAKCAVKIGADGVRESGETGQTMLRKYRQQLGLAVTVAGRDAQSAWVSGGSSVGWARRKDTKDPRVDLSDDALHFQSQGGPDRRVFECTVEFYKPVDSAKARRVLADRSLQLVIPNKDGGPFWPRLLESDEKTHGGLDKGKQEADDLEDSDN